MKLEHTPGPWGLSSETPTTIKAFDAFGETQIIIGSASSYQGSPFFPSDETAVLNAQLMAAAPALKNALTVCLKRLVADCSDKSCVEIMEARAALTAAGVA